MSRHEAREKAMQLLYQLEIQTDNYAEQIKRFLEERTPLKTDVSEDGQIAVALAQEAELDSDAGKAALRLLNGADREYLQRLVEGVLAQKEALDLMLVSRLKKWTPERLPKLERTLLRIGAYEICFDESVPDSVAINEVVELSKRYADEASYSYINAILGRISREKEAGAADAAEIENEGPDSLNVFSALAELETEVLSEKSERVDETGHTEEGEV